MADPDPAVNDPQCTSCSSADVEEIGVYTAGRTVVAVKGQCRTCGCIYVDEL